MISPKNVITLFSPLMVISCVVGYLLTNFPAFTYQNALFLMITSVVMLSVSSISSKDTFEYLLIALLGVLLMSGPLKILTQQTEYVHYYIYNFLELIFSVLLLLFLFTVLVKLNSRLQPILNFLIVMIIVSKILSIVIIEVFPAEMLVQIGPQGERFFDFFNFEFFMNKFIQATAGFMAIFLIIYYFFSRGCPLDLSVRTVLFLCGVIVFIINMHCFVIFNTDDYWSIWVHSFLEVTGFIPLFLWFVASRIDEKTLFHQEKLILWSVQISLLLPLLYLFLTYPGKRVLLVSLSVFSLLELLYILFYVLLQQRYTINKMSHALQGLVDNLGILWNRNTDGVIITDHSGTILSASEHLHKLYGNTMEGLPFHSLLISDDKNLSSESTTTIETILNSKDGNQYPILLTTHSLQNIHSQLQLNLVSDMNQKEKLDRIQQQQYNRAFELKRIRSMLKLNENLSHNIFNYLSGMLGYTQLIEMNFDLNTDEARAHVSSLSNSIEEFIAYIKKFIDSNRSTIKSKAWTPLFQAIDEAKARLKETLGDAIQNYVVSIQTSRIDEFIVGKCDHLSEIFYQFLLNAAESMPSGGKIAISVEKIIDEPSASSSSISPYIRVNVTDEGRGISTKIKDFIFDPFFSTKDVVGTGLGLSIIQNIALLNDWKIGFKSNDQRGSTFYIQIPNFVAPHPVA